ncbi:MAG: LysR family transcriptional regulator [Pseudohongiella sp.]|nr:LysR family transcriptional regulator [Pseudohongiella sp.]MDO9519116.1 LysR family transcriptional regulator [Pseudohongiella sp.]MDP2129121.1 LysR family transcriptional regulator [Pseudohongiella sp.]
MLEIRHLKTLVTLRDTGSLVEASERLCVTQSALSHQIKDLETRLGCELFMRKSRPLRFTEPGQRLLALADEVLGKVDDAVRDVQKLLHGDAGRLHMAIECHSCFNWLMPVLDTFRRQWPGVALDFSGGFLFEPLPALARGEVDLVITSDPQSITGISYLPLFTYEMQIALANDHRLLKHERVQPRDLTDETLITYPVARERLDVFNCFLHPAGISPAAVRHTELTLMMVQLVASGLGVCALPNWVLADYLEQGLISARSAGDHGIWPTLYAAVRAEQLEQAYLQDFMSLATVHCLRNLKGVTPVRESIGRAR